jgi:hypothetical protein
MAGIALEAAVPRVGSINPAVFVWISVIGVSVYAYQEAVPAWTLTWLGFGNFLVLFIIFGLTFGAVKSVLGLSWPLAYTAAFLVKES